jgi:hypothetical protein
MLVQKQTCYLACKDNNFREHQYKMIHLTVRFCSIIQSHTPTYFSRQNTGFQTPKPPENPYSAGVSGSSRNIGSSKSDKSRVGVQSALKTHIPIK